MSDYVIAGWNAGPTGPVGPTGASAPGITLVGQYVIPAEALNGTVVNAIAPSGGIVSIAGTVYQLQNQIQTKTLKNGSVAGFTVRSYTTVATSGAATFYIRTVSPGPITQDTTSTTYTFAQMNGGQSALYPSGSYVFSANDDIYAYYATTGWTQPSSGGIVYDIYVYY